MAIKRKKRFHAGVESSSMSDIMFFLLLFFLIISTLANPNVIKVPLPDAKETDTKVGSHLTLTVTSEKRYYLDKEEVSPQDLEVRLLQETKLRKDETVVLRPAYDLDVQELIDLLQLGLKHQLKFVIATKAG
ncbi:ExbD/TolR family protein [Fluviicola chungangensis]|uniref:Biopolymer transporter ExbD n=1 Tax=Fluviicola chungangensis TaxID=2597671 RepID=A0A556MJW0_9FLAO|nr:biopolymer transporter ExbD [Fluviicola chungangensis]TSJ40149.1 biopolymer transporter ExbD [Fluviicola chungangensis]